MMLAMVTVPADRSGAESVRHEGSPTAPAALSSGATALMTPLSELLRSEMEKFIKNQFRMISEYRPSMYRNDTFMITVRHICQDNIAALARILAHAPDYDESFVPKADAYARGAATSQSGITLTELLDLYRRGQAQLFQDLLHRMSEEFPSGEAFNEALHYCTVCWNSYIDAVLTRTVAGFVHDRERLRIDAQARRSRLIDALLSGAAGDVGKISAQLSYELRASHLGLVIRRRAGGADEPELEPRATRFAERSAPVLGARSTLLSGRGADEVWLWFALAEPPKPTAAEVALRRVAEQLELLVAVGKPGWGPGGFVKTNREARWADNVVRQAPNPESVTGYESVAALSLVRPDKEHIVEFVRDELGELAVRDRRTQLLRETVAVFLREGRNARAAAEVLNTHKNTVIYRIGKAEEMMKRTLADGGFELEMALRLVDLYGEWTLSD
jgi:hypothetical protein